MEICYDLRFPEVTRTLALHGADLVAHPTNFPVAAKVQTEIITLARAAENRIYLLTANRVGKERTGEFCGHSQIVDPYGTRLAEADPTEETLLVAEVDVEKARDKDYVIPGEYELYLFGHRRPELYGALVEETDRPTLQGGAAMAVTEETSEAILEQDGVKVSKSPWGPDDEIGRLNWITPETNRAILEHLDGAHLFDLNVEYFIGMPSWVAAGDPPYGIWMTHTPQGSINDNLSGVGSHVHEKYSYCGDSIHLYTHCGTHIDTLNHLGHLRASSGTAGRRQGPRQPHLEQGRPRQVPADHRARRAARRRRDARRGLPPRRLRDHARRPPEGGRASRGSTSREERRARAHRPDDRSGRTSTATWSGRPGSTSRSAKWLCEEMGAMCIAGDSIGLEVLPSEESDVFLPVHAYMFATAGAQIIEVVDMEEIAAEKQYEFAFLGFPMKLRGATGAPMPSLRGAAEELVRADRLAGARLSERPIRGT